jgi:hypothetical protein
LIVMRRKKKKGVEANNFSTYPKAQDKNTRTGVAYFTVEVTRKQSVRLALHSCPSLPGYQINRLQQTGKAVGSPLGRRVTRAWCMEARKLAGAPRADATPRLIMASGSNFSNQW